MAEGEFTERSILTISTDCEKGHCGCYYTNGNICCRCRKVQLEFKRYEPRVVYVDRPFRKNDKKIGEVPPKLAS